MYCFGFLASVIILDFWLKENFHRESSIFSFLVMSQVLVFVIWMPNNICHFWGSNVLVLYDFSFLVTIDMVLAHLTQQLSSALGICPYTTIHKEKKKQCGNDLQRLTKH